MNHRAYANQYRQTSVSSSVLDADPHRLIALMLAGLRNRLRLAIACMETGNFARKGEAIGEASTIVGHLDGCLNHEAGGEIAANLASLYDYIQRRLVEGNARNDADALRECDMLMGEIESAWNAIATMSVDAPSTSGAAA